MLQNLMLPPRDPAALGQKARASPRCGIEAVKIAKHIVCLCMMPSQSTRTFEECFGDHGEEFRWIRRTVAIDKSTMSATAVFDKPIEFRSQD